MRKFILISTVLLAFAITAIAAGIYWRTHHDSRDGVRIMKRVITKDFHDPESARFRTVQLQSMEGSIAERLKIIDATFLWRSTPSEVISVFRYDPEYFQLCGEVNAKNGFGAYVGYRRFYVSGGNKPISFIDSRENDDFAKKMCDIGKEFVVFAEPDTE